VDSGIKRLWPVVRSGPGQKDVQMRHIAGGEKRVIWCNSGWRGKNLEKRKQKGGGGDERVGERASKSIKWAVGSQDTNQWGARLEKGGGDFRTGTKGKWDANFSMSFDQKEKTLNPLAAFDKR